VEWSRRSFLGLIIAGSSPLAAASQRISGRTPPRLFDIEKVMPAIAPYRRKAIRLHPSRSAAPLATNASKMGGIFHWPANEPWPYCRESDPPPDRSNLTLDRVAESVQAIKLGERLARENRIGPPPPGSRNPEEWKKWNRDAAEFLKNERAKGLPELSEADMAKAEQQLSEMERSFDDMSRPHNTPYQTLVQLRRDEFPELPWPVGSDLFQLLWCPRVHLWGNSLELNSKQSNGARIIWRKESSARAVMPVQSPHPARLPVHECSLQPEDIVEYPQAVETVAEIEAAIPKLQNWFDALQPRKGNDPGAEWRYSYDIAVSPGTKLLGYAQWIQAEEIPTCGCGREMKLLITCASQETMSDGVWESVSAEKGRAREEHTHPFGFEWGDWSNAYVFYCATGHRLNTTTIVQSS
jgi:hypothetical protein